jgi:hypothetical protein
VKKLLDKIINKVYIIIINEIEEIRTMTTELKNRLSKVMTLGNKLAPRMGDRRAAFVEAWIIVKAGNTLEALRTAPKRPVNDVAGASESKDVKFIRQAGGSLKNPLCTRPGGGLETRDYRGGRGPHAGTRRERPRQGCPAL